MKLPLVSMKCLEENLYFYVSTGTFFHSLEYRLSFVSGSIQWSLEELQPQIQHIFTGCRIQLWQLPLDDNRDTHKTQLETLLLFACFHFMVCCKGALYQ